MSLWTRLVNVVRGDRLTREIDEELESHLAEAIEHGRDPDEARRAFGSRLRLREQSRDVRLWAWLDSLRADAVFGWRQLAKRKVASAAAIVSLGLGIGACVAAFRLIDALLLRPLPVAHADRLFVATKEGKDFDGQMAVGDDWSYVSFEQMRAAVKDRAELIAVSYAQRSDITYRSDDETERAYVQYASGDMFGVFGLKPAVGRLLTASDDRKPGEHPYAVLSYDYWTRRFGRDPRVVGRTFRMADRLYEIVGVVEPPFSGTELGTMVDAFVPATMHPGASHDDWTWHRTLAILRPGATVENVRAQMHSLARAFEENRAKGFTGMSQKSIDDFLAFTVYLRPAAAGASELQHTYRPALAALALLVVLVLLIACANVANLLTAQAASRAREMALRVSIGAGRARLIQLVLMESALMACAAAVLGNAFAWWAAPFVVSRVNPADSPARLSMPADWRLAAFSIALTFAVALLFGLAPALRASSVQPVNALKGGADPHARRRSMQMLIGAQAALCFLVLFLSGLFLTSFNRLAHKPLGFVPERLLNVETVAAKSQTPEQWAQVAAHLRQLPGVESVAMAGWPLMQGNAWNGFISVDGAPPGPVLAYFLRVSPGWVDTMKIQWVDGRDFRQTDSSPGPAIVNEAFVRQYLNGRNVLGTPFTKGDLHFVVAGVVRDVPYRAPQEQFLPAAYVPIRSVDEKGQAEATGSINFAVRTKSDRPLALAGAIRQGVSAARPGLRVSNIRTQVEINESHTVRERLLAMLAAFFAVVALLLAGVGLYGVLDYSVLQRRRELGIRIAIGAPAGEIARRVTVGTFAVVLTGAAIGLVAGRLLASRVESLLYQVKAGEASMLLLPALILGTVALLAAVPAVVRALRIDPVAMLRAE